MVAIFPQQERDFRDIIESWLLWEHDRSGFHSFDMDTTVNRDANTTRPAGSLFYNTTLNVLQFCIASTPSYVWDSISFPPGTRLLFNNTTPPPGWTKVVDAAYNDALIRIVTGTPGAPSGDVGMSDIFTAAFGIVGNTASHALTIAQMPAHGHPWWVANTFGDSSQSSGGIQLRAGGNGTPAHSGPASQNNWQTIGGTGGNDGHSHGINLSLDIHAKRVEFILCEKDDFA